MNASQENRTAAVVAGAAALMVFGMFLVDIVGGVAQQPFEELATVAEYQQSLRDADSWLRVVFTLDNLFIGFYTAVFLFAVHIFDSPQTRLFLRVALVALLVAAVLDLRENHHIMTMLVAAREGLPITAQELHERARESQLKFHISYVGLFLLGIAMPSKTLAQKAVRYSLLFLQMPLGILVYTYPHPMLELARFGFFFFGMALLCVVFAQNARQVATEV